MSLTPTPAQQASIAALVQRMELSAGLGTEENACSVAAINLALTGELTDNIPACMSVVIGKWIIGVQDRMPFDMRNSSEWKRLLPLAAGTGRDRETERLTIVTDWMWSALTLVQPLADTNGFGTEWAAMCRERSATAARTTFYAALATTRAAAAAAAFAAIYATEATAATICAATESAYVAAYPIADADWQTLNPPALLSRLIALDL